MRLPENWWLIILLFLLLFGMFATLFWGKGHSRHGYGQRHVPRPSFGGAPNARADDLVSNPTWPGEIRKFRLFTIQTPCELRYPANPKS